MTKEKLILRKDNDSMIKRKSHKENQKRDKRKEIRSTHKTHSSAQTLRHFPDSSAISSKKHFFLLCKILFYVIRITRNY